MSDDSLFEPLPPECGATVNVTSFRCQGKTYTISTTDITPFLAMQARADHEAGYTGELGAYETMLFIEQESLGFYPFGDLPGHPSLGVFQRYTTEDAARDGHHAFVTVVQRTLRKKLSQFQE